MDVWGKGAFDEVTYFTHAMFVVTMHKRQPIIQYARTDDLMCVCVCTGILCACSGQCFIAS